jgi:type I restriction enzyme S subunit
METLSPYPEYRKAGPPWICEIPAHWRLGRLKESVVYSRNGIWGNDPDGINDIPCVRVADFDRYTMRVRLTRPTLRAVTASERHGRVLKPGDLLLEKSGGGELQPVGTVILYDHEESAVCSNFIARMLVSPGFDPRFLTYLHTVLYSIRLNLRSIKQTTGTQNLDEQSYLAEAVAYPPEREQQAIARFLDRQDRRISRFIRAKRRLIELLTEQKQAMIHQAVTRGLDPNVPLKSSGIDWLGDVPTHWDVVRAGSQFTQRREASEIDLPLLEVAILTGVRVRDVDMPERKQMMSDRSGYQTARRGDIA